MVNLIIQGTFGLEGAEGSGKLSRPVWLAAIGDFNYLYATGVLFVATIAVIVVASYSSPAPAAEQTRGRTYYRQRPADTSVAHESVGAFDIGLTAMVLGIVLGVYLYFSTWT